MIEHFTKRYILGSKEFVDNKDNKIIKQINSKWYVQQDGKILGSIDQIYSSEEISSMLIGEDVIESFEMLGYFLDSIPCKLTYKDQDLSSSIKFVDDTYYVYAKHKDVKLQTFISVNLDQVIAHILNLQDKYISCNYSEITSRKNNYRYITFVPITAKKKRKINKGNNNDSREITRNMIRVKSSNVWAYAMKIPEEGDTGNLFVQFKAKKGGPGDIYEYFDVPIRLWTKFVATGSKGHFFWKFIRNKYLYRKLTGDKRGKLPNAVY